MIKDKKKILHRNLITSEWCLYKHDPLRIKLTTDEFVKSLSATEQYLIGLRQQHVLATTVNMRQHNNGCRNV